MLSIEIPSSVSFDGRRLLRKSPTTSKKDGAKTKTVPFPLSSPTSPSSPSSLPTPPLSRSLSLALSRSLPRSKTRSDSNYAADYKAFIAMYPNYKATSILDDLRKKEFERLDKSKEVYVDYMGGCLWPRSLISRHASLLESGLFGNTHSDSPCAIRSDHHIAAARNAVLQFFGAPSSDYVCIFTANATTALKLVGESFPFEARSRLVVPADCHNSVNGIRSFADEKGATVDYLESTPVGGFDEKDAQAIFELHQMENSKKPSLFVLTGQSNITGIRPSFSILSSAKAAGFYTVIDAAALASSARVSLENVPDADAMVVSFYKMFGYPTGVGALIAKKSFLERMERTWFSGGSVDFVQAPGMMTLHAKDLGARFEEGTLNYSSLSAIAPGLELLGTYMPYMSLRLPDLHHYLHTALESLVYPGTSAHLVKIHTMARKLLPEPNTQEGQKVEEVRRVSSRSTSGSSNGSDNPASPTQPMTIQPITATRATGPFRGLFSRARRSTSPATGLPTPPMSPISPLSTSGDVTPTDPIGLVINNATNAITNTSESSDPTEAFGQGYVVSCTFYTREGKVIPLSHVSKLASSQGISLRTGCVCNPGGSAALRGKHIQERMDSLSKFDSDTAYGKHGEEVPLKTVCEIVGGLSSAGVVRLSLGLASNFEDVWRLVNWAKNLLDEEKRESELKRLLQ